MSTVTQFESLYDERLGSIKAVEHRIEPDIRKADQFTQAHIEPAENKNVEKQKIDRMLTMDVIEPAQMEWASRIVFVLKKDDKFRSWVGY